MGRMEKAKCEKRYQKNLDLNYTQNTMAYVVTAKKRWNLIPT